MKRFAILLGLLLLPLMHMIPAHAQEGAAAALLIEARTGMVLSEDNADEVLPVAQQHFSGFSYFKRLLVGGDSMSLEFWRALRNTFLLSFYGLCFGFPMPIVLALFFNEIRSNIVRSTCQVLTYLPKFMSTVVMTSLVTMLVKQGSLTTGMGIISQAMEALGIISFETANAGLLNNPDFFRAIYQISGIWEGAGYDSIVYFAAIIAISPTSYEAAQIDGASGPKRLLKVTIPMMMPSITICTFLSLTNGFKLFDQNIALTGGYPYLINPDGTSVHTTEMLALNIYNTFYVGANTRGVAQAKAVLFFILVATLAIAQLTATRKKEVQQ